MGNAAVIANDPEDFWDGTLNSIVDVDENGAMFGNGGEYFWAGTNSSGAQHSYSTNYCNDWTAGSGNSGPAAETQSASDWIFPQLALCQMQHRLLCISIADDIN